MKTIKQQLIEEIAKFHREYGYNQKLRGQIQKDLKGQDKAEMWELEDAIADFNNNFNYK
jgi:ATP-dependent Lon protease